MLGEQMLEHLRIKFQGHWYPERPTKGSAYRSIRISKEKVDKVLVNAAIRRWLGVCKKYFDTSTQ